MPTAWKSKNGKAEVEHNDFLSSNKSPKEAAKATVKPGGQVGLINNLVTDIDMLVKGVGNEIFEPFNEANETRAVAGVDKGLFNLGHHAYAEAEWLTARAGLGKLVEVKASVASASSYAQYGLHNSAGAKATLLRAEADLHGARLGVGLSLDTSVDFGVRGVGASLLGFGFNLGPESTFKTPIFDFTIRLW